MSALRPAPRAILHVDMDAFYASVEQRDNPEIRGQPVIVGADPKGRGVVTAASYEARPFGVHSAMPIRTAARLCPQAIFLPVDMAKYARVSGEIMAILADFSPLVEPVSIDEAFIDLTGTAGLHGPPLRAARTVKDRIRSEVGLVASLGLAPNKFLAKVASDLGKPDGLVEVTAGREADFLAPLPIRRLWGVGAATERELASLGVATIGQLAQLPRATLEARLGRAGRDLRELALGRDDRPVDPGGAPKSMGAEETFERDHRDLERLRRVLRAQAERVARELRAQGFAASRVTLKVRAADFRTLTRSRTGDPTQDGLEIYQRAVDLLGRVALRDPVRLIGLSVSALGPPEGGQLPLLDPGAIRRERLARAIDRLASRFGADSIRPASLLPRPNSD
jgi:DNA polymerase IV